MNIATLSTFHRRMRAFLGRPLLMRQKSVITLDTIDYCPNPVFVMGCHRSGTSLLRRILNSHNNIACPPETNYLVHFINILRDQSSVSGLLGMMDKDDIKPEVARLAFRFHEAFRVARNKPRWADKTPQYVPYFDDLVGLAPTGSQFVVIFRNPFDIAYSIYNRGWRLEHLDEDLLTNTCLYVRKILEKLQEIAGREDVHAVYYEKIVDDPEEQTRALCAFLGESWDEAMIRPWDFDHNFGTEDPIARSQKKFELSSQNWKGLSLKERDILNLILGQIAQDLGYENTY